MSVPEGVTIGGLCLAQGLFAGTKRPFQALLVGVRKNSPPLLVKYCADEAGRRKALHLPEMRKAYVLPSDVQPWRPHPSTIHTPHSAKTRAQKVNREEEIVLASMYKKKKKRHGKRVTWAELPPPLKRSSEPSLPLRSPPPDHPPSIFRADPS